MIVAGNALALPFAANTVQCCVTSPPYWGLRDYGVLGQLGIETTIGAYVSSMVAVFREVRRVLRDDGVLFLNLGDSFARDSGKGEKFRNGKNHRWSGQNPNGMTGPDVPSGLKPKDLVGIPWRVAFALQADGWWLRSDIIWAKPNPMPESVTDRPTKSHEYVFLLTKSARYYWDAEAVAEPSIHAGKVVTNDAGKNSEMGAFGQTRTGFLKPEGVTVKDNRNLRSVWSIATQPFTGWTKTSRQVRVSWDAADDDTTRRVSPDCPVHGDRAVGAAKAACGEREALVLSRTPHNDGGPAEARSVGCGPSGSPREGCSVAGSWDSADPLSAPTATPRNSRSRRTDHALSTTQPCMPFVETDDGIGGRQAPPETTEARSRTPENSTPVPPDLAAAVSAQTAGDIASTSLCSCAYYNTVTEEISHFATMPEKLVEPCIKAGSRPGDLVLDPFTGSGTVGVVCRRFARRFVGVELNPAYIDMARRRLKGQLGMPMEASA